MKKPYQKSLNKVTLIAILALLTTAVFCGPPKPTKIPVEKEEPIPSISEVRQRLHDLDAVTRGMAAAEVLRYSMTELQGDLLTILNKDPSENARTAAAIALAAMGEQKAASGIATLLQKKQGQSDLLVEAMGELKNPYYASYVVPFLTHSDTMTRLKAAEALGKMRAVNQGNNILSQAQKQKDTEIIEAHIIALGNIGYHPADKYILAQVQKFPNTTVAAAGLLALGKLQSQRAIPVFLKTMIGSDTKLQENAATALRQIKTKESRDGLFKILATQKGDTKLLAIDILADFPPQLVKTKARKLISGGDKQLYAAGAFILGKIKDIESREKIEQVLRDPETENREMAARALGYLGQQESVAVLREVAQEKSGRARYGALWSLGIMAAKEALPEIRAAVVSSDREFAAYGIEALAAMPEEQDLDILENYLKKDDGIQLLAASAIAKIPSEKALKVLEKAAKSSDLTIRGAGFEGLSLRADKDSLPFLIQQLKDGNSEVRKLSIAALRNVTNKKFDTPAQWINWYTSTNK